MHPKKLVPIFLKVEMEKVNPSMNQKEKGYLTYGRIDALFLLNLFFLKER